MNNTINSNTYTPSSLVQGQKNPADSSDAAAGAQAAGAAQSADSVNLTASAKALGEASRVSEASSGVDSQRVEHVRQALANGSYKVDAGRIADKMVSIEGQIDGTR
ncbi:flagellar biosynthesis anti-sigma factor FlgM [Oleiagrimonas sp. C23AA]|uniref:flagellar biosynthesis anti-sigma factor FlgM n=1 Tax=Oleiagrimonas sp. C23AA TaxID=2719047 RepID=UPI001421E0E5|nr:flagellar biosynthesis anti-sigma factor FlgM [Oleiagrimonas sp. C23AA]NII09218.1 flagellar biosynthesis anti-sigma factor FlgM [Oleiagrimonas sp. C23AA]